MAAVTGVGISTLKYWSNDWHTPRTTLDKWDKVSLSLKQNMVQVVEHVR